MTLDFQNSNRHRRYVILCKCLSYICIYMKERVVEGEVREVGRKNEILRDANEIK